MDRDVIIEHLQHCERIAKANGNSLILRCHLEYLVDTLNEDAGVKRKVEDV
jgi:hypothetical protein